MTTAKEIVAELKRMFPEKLRWDTTEGLVAGDTSRQVKKAILSLEFRDNIADTGADMLILHHPPRFGPRKSITNPAYKRHRNSKAVIYAAHTRMDKTGFVGKAIAERLFGRIGYKVLDVTRDGTVMIRLRKRLTDGDAIREIKKALGLRSVNAITNRHIVRCVGILGGSGFSRKHIIGAVKAGADLYISGDMSHHAAESARFFDINFVDIGHFREQEGMRKLAGVLKAKFPGVRFEYVEQSPLWSTR
jgi:putative NIF3 family GTP cyclohydrolase 1 type 2